MGHFCRNRVSLGKRGFQKVFEKSYRCGDRLLLVLATKNQETFSRLGLAISRKYIPRAVDRNHIKRLIRESFYQQQPFSAPLDIVVMSRSGSRHCSKAEIHASLSRHWQCILNKINKA